MVKVSPSIVPVVTPAPSHRIVRSEPFRVYVALTSRVASVPDGGENTIRLLQVPSALTLKLPDLTANVCPSC